MAFPQHPLVEHPKEALPMKEKQEDPALPVWGLCSHSGDIRVGMDIPRPGCRISGSSSWNDMKQACAKG